MRAAAALGLAAALAVAAAVPAGEARAQRASPAAAASALHLAHSLVRHGDRSRDALSLIAAARIMAAVGARERRATQAGTRPKTDLAVVAVLGRAKAYAGGRADLVALADDVLAAAPRGNLEGPVRMFAIVQKQARDSFEFDFRGGESAFVGVSGDGDSDLDLFVYDAAGKLVCAAEGDSDDEICRWLPKADAKYRIVIRNLGIENQYFLVTN